MKISNTDKFINDVITKGYSITFREDVHGTIAHIKYKDNNVVVPYETVKDGEPKAVMEYVELKIKDLKDT